MPEHAPTKRVIDILCYLARDRRGDILSAIARGIGSPVSTCAMILRTLRHRGMLEYNPETRRYSLGFGIHALSSAYVGMKSLLRGAVGAMHGIAGAVGESCGLAVLSGASALCIAKVDPAGWACTAIQVGVGIPACCTAAGKALLADADMPLLHGLYGASLPALTPFSLARFEELALQLKAIREGGVATGSREFSQDAVAWALPLRFRGQVAASLSVAVPPVRGSSEKAVQVAAALHKGQRRIEALMEEQGESLASDRWTAILPFVQHIEDRGV